MELGGVARISSIIYFSKNEEEALKNGIKQAQVTHTSFQSLLTTEFFIKLIYKMLSDKNIEEAIKSIIAEYKDENKQFSYLENAYLKAKENLELDYKEAIMNIGQTCNGCEAFPAVLYFILKYDNFKDAEIANVNSGGDSAARGIIIGMIFGARDGEEALTKESYIIDTYYMLANNYYLLYEDQKVVDLYLSQADKMNELDHPFKEEFKKIAETSNDAIKETNKAAYEKNKKLLEMK